MLQRWTCSVPASGRIRATRATQAAHRHVALSSEVPEQDWAAISTNIPLSDGKHDSVTYLRVYFGLCASYVTACFCPFLT